MRNKYDRVPIRARKTIGKDVEHVLAMQSSGKIGVNSWLPDLVEQDYTKASYY